jgi:hypothetical protein
MMTNLRRRTLSTAFLLAIAPALAACDSSTEPEEEPEVVAVRLTVGTQIVTVADNGVVTGGPIAIGVGATAISAVFLNAAGEPDDHVSADEFELLVVPGSTGVVTFARTSAFAGTLTGVAVGNTSIEVALFHIEEQHEDFGPFLVALTVQ